MTNLSTKSEREKADLEFREMITKDIYPRGFYGSDYKREIIVTPFDGSYGRAGFMITINGSPPRLIMAVLNEEAERVGYAVVMGASKPLMFHPVNDLWGSTRKAARTQRVLEAVKDLLASRGFLRRTTENERSRGIPAYVRADP